MSSVILAVLNCSKRHVGQFHNRIHIMMVIKLFRPNFIYQLGAERYDKYHDTKLTGTLI